MYSILVRYVVVMYCSDLQKLIEGLLDSQYIKKNTENWMTHYAKQLRKHENICVDTKGEIQHGDNGLIVVMIRPGGRKNHDIFSEELKIKLTQTETKHGYIVYNPGNYYYTYWPMDNSSVAFDDERLQINTLDSNSIQPN